MIATRARCLILACGNALRRDDGVGPWLADWAADHFANDPRIRVIFRQQWTPDLAQDIACAESVLFVDCSVESSPGEIQLRTIAPQCTGPGLATHHTGAGELLALALELYASTPSTSLLLTIGAGCTELGESFSAAVTAAIPEACALVEETVRGFLG
jgi:hydrogenase maturation protease